MCFRLLDFSQIHKTITITCLRKSVVQLWWLGNLNRCKTYLKHRPGMPRLGRYSSGSGSRGSRRRSRHVIRRQRLRYSLKSRPHRRRHFCTITLVRTQHLASPPLLFASSATAARSARPTGPGPHQDADTAPDLAPPIADQQRPSNRIFDQKKTSRCPILKTV